MKLVNTKNWVKDSDWIYYMAGADIVDFGLHDQMYPAFKELNLPYGLGFDILRIMGNRVIGPGWQE